MKTIRKQFLFALGLFLVYYVVTTVVYYLYGDPGSTVADAIYMTGISFTTIGYGDNYWRVDFQIGPATFRFGVEQPATGQITPQLKPALPRDDHVS